MSWDLEIWYESCPHCGSQGHAVDVGNFTHNTNAMIRAASVAPALLPEQPSPFDEVILRKPTQGLCWGDFDGKPAAEVGLFAMKIEAEIKANLEKYQLMDDPSGWGTAKQLLEFLWQVSRACEENPRGIFRARG